MLKSLPFLQPRLKHSSLLLIATFVLHNINRQTIFAYDHNNPLLDVASSALAAYLRHHRNTTASTSRAITRTYDIHRAAFDTMSDDWETVLRMLLRLFVVDRPTNQQVRTIDKHIEQSLILDSMSTLGKQSTKRKQPCCRIN